MQVNSDTTSKDTKISPGSRVCSSILSAKTLLFLTEYLLFWMDDRQAMFYVEEPIELQQVAKIVETIHLLGALLIYLLSLKLQPPSPPY